MKKPFPCLLHAEDPVMLSRGCVLHIEIIARLVVAFPPAPADSLGANRYFTQTMNRASAAREGCGSSFQVVRGSNDDTDFFGRFEQVQWSNRLLNYRPQNCN